MERTMEMHGGKVYRVAVSGYGLDNRYLDYRTLADIIGDPILNNRLMTFEEFYWELVSGQDQYAVDKDGNECHPDSDECYGVYIYDAYQTYGASLILELAGIMF